MLTKEQVALLNEPLLSEDVKTRDGTGNTKLSYLASFHVIAEANRIFGFDGWSTEIISLDQVDRTEYEKKGYKPTDPVKKMMSISYMCRLKLIIEVNDYMVTREDVGFGNGVAGASAYGIGSCIELASKEAVTDALKRCLRYSGNKFGLTLYDKDDHKTIDSAQFESSRLATESELSDFRKLYVDRGIDDEWVLIALKADGCVIDSLDNIRKDWLEHAHKFTHKFKLAEINDKNYDVQMEKSIKLMNESVSYNMVKALFTECFARARDKGDKEKMMECKEVYDKMKMEFGQ